MQKVVHLEEFEASMFCAKMKSGCIEGASFKISQFMGILDHVLDAIV